MPTAQVRNLVRGEEGTFVKMTVLRKGDSRSFNVERAVNARFGVSAERDKLPKRLTDVRQYPDDPRSVVPLEQMKRIYYSARGWGPTIKN